MVLFAFFGVGVIILVMVIFGSSFLLVDLLRECWRGDKKERDGSKVERGAQGSFHSGSFM